MGYEASRRCSSLCCTVVHFLHTLCSFLSAMLRFLKPQPKGGVSEKSNSVGGFDPPPFLKTVRGGFLRVFFDADTPFLRKLFLVIFFWTAHPKFRPSLQFSHF